MMKVKGAGVAIGLCVGLAVSTAWAENSPFIGKWRLNAAQSSLPPGEPPPTDLTNEITSADGNHLSWSVTVVTPQGQPASEKFDVVTDGGYHPVSTDTTAAFRLAGNTLQAIFKGPSGESDAQTCTLSADQKRMTCKGVLTTQDGQATNYVDVYDRL
jgi:hypothetical protein